MTAQVTGRMRDRVLLYQDGATGDSADPDNVRMAGTPEPCEIIDLKGGEVIRGRTFEANIAALVTMTLNSRTAKLNARSMLLGRSFPWFNVQLFVNAVGIKKINGIPRLIELDCRRDI